MAPCDFVQGSLAVDNCSDTAQDSAANVYEIICDTDVCQCCGAAGCADISATPTAVCRSAATLRDALVTECMQDSACGEICPAVAPQSGSVCNELEVRNCYYSDGNTCLCQAGEYYCSTT
jgi:hypothetical protein